MKRVSLRGWLLLVSIIFAFLVVGGIAVTTYVIVSDGMREVARETAEHLSQTAATLVTDTVAEADTSTTPGTSAQQRAAAAQAKLVASLPALFSRITTSQAEFVLFGADLEPLWSSSGLRAGSSFRADRERAVRTGLVVHSHEPGSGLMGGLLRKADLGATVTHVPITLPGGAVGVLDVKYRPTSEDRAIDRIRVPMAVLAVTALLIMVALMQTSMIWVLRLVDSLREAADSIDAGRLDDRLPEVGNQEIAELARSINRLIERLRRRSEAQTHFVADASHELATPVAGIRGYTSILRAWGAEDPKVRDEAIDAIDRESRRMARLTGDLLNLLHADQGIVLKSGRFDLNALCRERIAASASRWIDKGLEYEGPEGDPLIVVGDADRVEDVISILLDNASKYTPSGGHVTVATKRRRDTVTVSISDTGRGIPAEDLPRIFDRFFRSEASRAASEGGFGLGLAIAKSLVDSMSGEITATSTEGEGTTFTITLPRGRV